MYPLKRPRKSDHPKKTDCDFEIPFSVKKIPKAFQRSSYFHVWEQKCTS